MENLRQSARRGWSGNQTESWGFSVNARAAVQSLTGAAEDQLGQIEAPIVQAYLVYSDKSQSTDHADEVVKSILDDGNGSIRDEAPWQALENLGHIIVYQHALARTDQAKR